MLQSKVQGLAKEKISFYAVSWINIYEVFDHFTVGNVTIQYTICLKAKRHLLQWTVLVFFIYQILNVVENTKANDEKSR